MTKEEKLQAIADMGVNIQDDCPSAHDFTNDCSAYSCCEECWIKTLEVKHNGM